MRHSLPFIGEEGVGLSPCECRRGLEHIIMVMNRMRLC